MAAQKKKTKRSKSDYEKLKPKVLARLAQGESGASISRDTGITESTISAWKHRAKKSKRTRAAQPEVTNGTPVPVSTPMIELKGLRAWVNNAVDERLAERLKDLASSLGKS